MRDRDKDEGRGTPAPALESGASCVRKRAFRFVLESSARSALRSAEDEAVVVVVVVCWCWAAAASEEEEEAVLLTSDALGDPAVAFVVGCAGSLNVEAEVRVIEGALGFVSVAGARFSCFFAAVTDFGFWAWGALGARWEDASSCSFCPRRWPCVWGR